MACQFKDQPHCGDSELADSLYNAALQGFFNVDIAGCEEVHFLFLIL